MELISDAYRQQQEQLHDAGQYGSAAADLYGELVASVIERLNIQHLLDYGCGKRLSLAKAIQGKVRHAFTYQAYDPAVPEFAAAPVPAQMVACIDVLEHIEEDRIDDVLDHLYELVEEVGLFTIATGPAMKALPDGRNAHVLQRPPEWWLPRLMVRFELQTFQVVREGHFYVIVNAVPRQIEAPDGTKLT